jgi:hypothetical protein
MEERIAQLESAIASLARKAEPQTVVVRRGGVAGASKSFGVTWLTAKETITTSATSTGGYVQFWLSGVPANASAVILEVFMGTGALALQPTATILWKAEENTAELTLAKIKASSIAGDFNGYSGLVMPVSGGSFFYNVSADWADLEIYVTGYFSETEA